MIHNSSLRWRLYGVKRWRDRAVLSLKLVSFLNEHKMNLAKISFFLYAAVRLGALSTAGVTFVIVVAAAVINR